MQCKLIAVLFLMVSSFNLMAFIPFTEREREIIHNGDGETPFRVLQVTDPVDSLVLRMKSMDVDPDSIVNDESLQLLIRRLIVTMHVSGGVGIAAPQVGVLKNIFLFTRLDLPDEPLHVVINPKIVNFPKDTVCFERDGCLSIPDIRANTLRLPWVDVEYWDEKGDFHRGHLEGYSRDDSFTAVIFQHEYDHLRGILFTDKICPETEPGWQ
ncbi:peptide deformylase [Porphyromonadaceae bacterium KH3CP3RA]|nr:peptide deformylase [Porphyromonadaceae bacterium KH3CP3RA]